jgi:hypothetical protein
MQYTPENAKIVSETAQMHLRRFSRNPQATCQKSLLLNEGFFCGFKFNLGPFHAEWRVGEHQLRFFREQDLILTADLAESFDGQSKAA